MGPTKPSYPFGLSQPLSALTTPGGAMIETRCYLDRPNKSQPTPALGPGWRAFKVGFVRVWGGRTFQ